jgi:hypothetical protein
MRNFGERLQSGSRLETPKVLGIASQCQGPVWCDGDHNGQRIRQNIETRAGRKLSDREDRLNQQARGK